MSVLSQDRMCPVCELPIVEAGTASYIDYAGMSMLFHDACLESLDEAIQEHNRPASQPMQKAESNQAVSDRGNTEYTDEKAREAAKLALIWLAEQIRQERHTN